MVINNETEIMEASGGSHRSYHKNKIQKAKKQTAHKKNKKAKSEIKANFPFVNEQWRTRDHI